MPSDLVKTYLFHWIRYMGTFSTRRQESPPNNVTQGSQRSVPHFLSYPLSPRQCLVVTLCGNLLGLTNGPPGPVTPPKQNPESSPQPDAVPSSFHIAIHMTQPHVASNAQYDADKVGEGAVQQTLSAPCQGRETRERHEQYGIFALVPRPHCHQLVSL